MHWSAAHCHWLAGLGETRPPAKTPAWQAGQMQGQILGPNLAASQWAD